MRNRLRIWSGCLALLALGCVTPQKDGKAVDADLFSRAEQRCQRDAIARYGPAPPGAQREGEHCDPRSWVCRRAEAWMLKEGNPLSSATPRDRRVYEHTKACLVKQGFRAR